MKILYFSRLVAMIVLGIINMTVLSPYAMGQTCAAPSVIFTGSTAPDVASFQWLQVPGATKYKLRIKPFKTQTWSNYSATVPFLQVSPYVGFFTFQMRSICSVLKSDWSPQQEACFNCKLEVEPNNKLGQALMTEGAEEYWVYGTVSVAGDTDFFCIKPFPGDGFLTVSLNYGGSEKYRIAAYTKSGSYIGASSSQLKNLNGNDTICFMVYGKDASQYNSEKPYSVLVKRSSMPQKYGATDLSDNVTTSMQRFDLSVFPNPATDAITIMSNIFTADNPASRQITIYNSMGERIIHKTLDFYPTEDYHINISGLSPGIYYLQLSSANAMVTTSFVKD